MISKNKKLINATEPKEKSTPLITAVEENKIEIIEFLLSRKPNLNAQDKVGYTAVAVAASNGYDAALMLLVAEKADVNISQRDGVTPLMWTVENNKPTTAQILLNAGADPNAKDIQGISACTAARIKDPGGLGIMLRAYGCE